MNCFELMSQVLEEEYSQIPGTDAERDAAVSAALKRLGDHYRLVTKNGPGDYKDRATRFAYIFCYTTCHANLVYQLIDSSVPLKAVFDQASAEIACIGGGPGSDYLGVLKYLLLNNKKPRLRCNLFDKESAWIETWSDVDQKVAIEIPLSLPFITLDVTNHKSWQPHTKYYRSHLFTFVYFLSEVVKHKAQATPYFTTLMQKANPGALFLFIDNNSSDHYGWFDLLAEDNGLVIIEQNRDQLKMPGRNDIGNEQSAYLGRFLKKFKHPDPNKFWSPKLNADVAYRIAQKPGAG